MVVTLRARDTGSKEEEEAVITEKICAPTTPVLLGSEVTIPIYVDEMFLVQGRVNSTIIISKNFLKFIGTK